MKRRICNLLLVFIIAFCMFGCNYLDDPYYVDLPTEDASSVGANDIPNNTDENTNTSEDASYLEGLTVYFLDVGQADSILIEADGEYCLIDAGNIEDGILVTNYLKELGIPKLKYVMFTHPHEDHIGGGDDVILGMPIDLVLMPDRVTTSNVFETLVDALERRNTVVEVPKVGGTYKLGDGKFTILSCASDSEDLNDTSIVAHCSYNDCDLIFTGDATKRIEKEILKNFEFDFEVEVLKVGHHGSNTSSSVKFLESVDPKFSIISAGRNNDYGHPHDEIMERLEKIDTEIFRTDTSGTIIMRSDGYEVSFEKTNIHLDGNELEEGNLPTQNYTQYIGNTNTKKYHLPECNYAKSIKEENKIEFLNEEEALGNNYKQCKSCLE